MRSLRLALAAVAITGAFAVPAAHASEPPIGICSYDIDWSGVNDVLAQLPPAVAATVVRVVCAV